MSKLQTCRCVYATGIMEVRLTTKKELIDDGKVYVNFNQKLESVFIT